MLNETDSQDASHVFIVNGNMADKKGYVAPDGINPISTRGEGDASPSLNDARFEDEQQFKLAESRKIGVTGAVFLILNKMIGTGSK